MGKFFSKIRRELSEAQNHRCAYCGCEVAELYEIQKRFGKHIEKPEKHGQLATIDHIIPLSKNGSNAKENLVVACQKCNKFRGSMDALVFFTIINDFLQRTRFKPAEMTRPQQDNMYQEVGLYMKLSKKA